MYYESLMVITKNNPITCTQMIKRRKNTRTKKSSTHRDSKKGQRELWDNKKAMNKMAISAYLSVIALNVNSLNSQIKRHRVD